MSEEEGKDETEKANIAIDVNEKENETDSNTQVPPPNVPNVRPHRFEPLVLSEAETESPNNTPANSVRGFDRRRNRLFELTRHFSSELLSVFEEDDDDLENQGDIVREPSKITYEQIQNFFVSFPLVVVPFLVFVHSFYLEISLFIYFTIITTFANKNLMQNMKLEFSHFKIFILIIFLIGNIVLVSFVVYPNVNVFQYFIFRIGNKERNFAQTFWLSVIVDFVGKLIVLLMKSVIIFILPFVPFVSSFRKGKFLSLIEQIMFSYRSAIPTIVFWVPYFLGSDEFHKIVSFLLLGIIFIFKFFSYILQFKELYLIAEVFFCRKSSVGKFTTLREEEKNEVCTICQEHYTNPVRLQCGHVFCYECIHRWSGKEKTCPLCRRRLRKHYTFGSEGETNLIPLVI